MKSCDGAAQHRGYLNIRGIDAALNWRGRCPALLWGFGIMRIGLIGTGAVAQKHAQAYENIGYRVAVCTNRDPEKGRRFASRYGCLFVPSFEDVCAHPEVDFVDVSTLPDLRLPLIEACARARKHVLVEKPMAIDLATACGILRTAGDGGIQVGVVSQHRFDDAVQFVKRALEQGRLGRILEADAYVKWWRSAEYYARPGKGTWTTEGGGALMNQAIHQIDLLLWLAGGVSEVFGQWQIGAAHAIESEDVVNAVLRYRSGAMGVVQAATAFWPGYPERVEIHGTKGTAVLAGDKLARWDVHDDEGEPAPPDAAAASGASDPMAISLAPFERQFLDFGEAIRAGRKPLVAAEDGYRALELTIAIYDSCRTGQKVAIGG
jgi:UDP-N-acetyl-2-amino-2-deoxyglucuronate dehydrogenase